MKDMNNMDMDQFSKNECPLFVLGGEICPTGILGVVHHISAYQSFSHVLISAKNFELLLIIVLSSILALFLFSRLLFFNQKTNLNYLIRWQLKKKQFSQLKSIKMSRWLSLFENSPSYFNNA
jgi:hypothetical protein